MVAFWVALVAILVPATRGDLPLKRLLIAVLAFSVSWCGCGGGGSKSTFTPQAQIAISPAAPQIPAGSTQLFTAQVTNSSTNAVTWAVNGTSGGSSTLGTIDANGLYTAPPVLPTPNTVTVSASLSSNPTVTGNTVATLLNPVPAISSASVAAVIPTAYGINVTGSGFVNGTRLLLGGNPVPATVLRSEQAAIPVQSVNPAQCNRFPGTTSRTELSRRSSTSTPSRSPT